MTLDVLTPSPLLWLDAIKDPFGLSDATDLEWGVGEDQGMAPPDWRQRIDSESRWSLFWNDLTREAFGTDRTRFGLGMDDAEIPPDLLTRLVTTLPFTRLVLDGPYEGWEFSDVRPGFLYKLPCAGWAMAMKGEQGHAQLSSRKWLDESPCKIHRLPGDVTVVQFCELDIDPKVAWDQAVEGWRFFRIDQPCSVQWNRPLNMTHAPGDYLPGRRTLRIPVYGTPVVDDEFLMDLVALRARKLLGESRPLDRIEFVFADPAEARAHLHRIWLMDMAVLTYVDGVETDLTDDYDPPRPDKPEWTKRVPDMTVGR